MKELTLGSLFDGIGGFPLAASRYGIKTLWASEIEPFPIKVTKTRLPDMKHLGDITQIHGAKIEPVDIITFGSPCQDLSVAGKRAGLAGERSGLFMEAVRIIKEMRSTYEGSNEPIRPRFAVWENVPGAFSSNKGEDFRAVLEEICRVKDETITIPKPPKGKWSTVGAIMGNGYSIAWRVLDAQFWGVPQRRRRIFLVADFGGQSVPEILFKRKGLSRYSQESGDKGERVATDAERSVGKTSYCIGHVVTTGGNCTAQGPCYKEEQCFTLKASGAHAVAQTPKTMLIRCGKEGGGKGPLIQDDKSATLSTLNNQTLFQPTEPIIFEPRSQDGVPRIHDEVVPTLNTAQGGQRQPCICLQDSMIGRAEKNGPQGDGINEDVSFTLNTTDRHAVATKAYGICSYASNSMKSDNPHSGIYEAETSRTIDLNGGSPACNQGGMAIVQTYSFQRSDEFKETDKASTQSRRQYKDATDLIVNSTYALDRASFNQGKNAQYDFQISEDDKTPTVVSRGPNAVAEPPRYSVRRLTPLECERLQGFPDGWTDIPGQTEATQEELEFWREVWLTWDKTQAEDPEKVKPRTDKRLLRWLKNPVSDTAQYKALGNSVAVPCPEYVLEGISEVLNQV